MVYQFTVGPVTWEYSADDLCFTARCGPLRKHIPWSEVLCAGLSPKRPIVLPPAFPTAILPGLAPLAKRAEELSVKTQHLWILRRIGRGRKLEIFNIAKGGDEQRSLPSDMRSRLGTRWSNQCVDLLEVRRKCGISNWWVYPTTTLLLIAALIFLLGWKYVERLRPVAIIMTVIAIASLVHRYLKRNRC